jgi:hypothetical protein
MAVLFFGGASGTLLVVTRADVDGDEGLGSLSREVVLPGAVGNEELAVINEV